MVVVYILFFPSFLNLSSHSVYRLSLATFCPASWPRRTSACGQTCCHTSAILATSPGTTPASSRKRATAAGTGAWSHETKPTWTPQIPEISQQSLGCVLFCLFFYKSFFLLLPIKPIIVSCCKSFPFLVSRIIQIVPNDRFIDACGSTLDINNTCVLTRTIFKAVAQSVCALLSTKTLTEQFNALRGSLSQRERRNESG